MKFLDEASGKEVEVPPEREAEARAAGLVPSDVAAAGEGTSLESIGRGAQRSLGALADTGGQVGEAIEGATGFGTAPGLESDEGGRPAGGQDLMPEAYDEHAKLVKEAHPFLSGVGTALGAAPLAAAAATLAPEVAAIPFLGGSVGGLAAGSAVQGTAQEYDDAWLRDNPMKLSNVVENTLMFAATDLGFMGAGKLLKGAAARVFGAAPEQGLSIGRTDMVSDAQRAAREASGEAATRPGINATPDEIAEPFHRGVDSMSNRDAAVLARDGEHYIQLAAQSSSDAFEQANKALSDAGADLKGWTAVQKAVLRSVGEEDLASPVGTMRALYSQDPRELAAFGRRLGGALDELDGLIKERGADGDILKGSEQYQGKPAAAPLEDARQAIASALQDYHVASAVGVARNQVENAAANPKAWGKLLLDVAGHAPVVGHGVRAARGAGHLLEALRGTGHTALEEGGALSNAFDGALDRYAQSPGWQNPSVAANYPPWITEQMGARRSVTADVAPGTTPAPGESLYGDAQPSAAYQRARAIIDRRKGQSGAVLLDEEYPAKLTRSREHSALLDSLDAKTASVAQDLGLDEQGLERILGVGILPHESVPSITAGRGGLHVKIDGPFEFERTIKRLPNGELEAIHSVFRLPTSSQGQGLAKEYLRDAAQQYVDMGVSTIRIPQATEDGVIVWPKLGARDGGQLLAMAREEGLEAPSLEALARSKSGERWLRAKADAEPRLFSELELDPGELLNKLGGPRARDIIDRRAGQSGAVELGAPKSPVSLAGKSLKDLGASADPTTFKPETLEALRTGKGGRKDFARDFGETGRVDQTAQFEQGIQVEMRGDKARLVDGRHRVMVGREKGLTEVYGQVYDGARAPGKKPIFEGMIPIAESPEGGFADLAGGIATSPMGATIGLGAVGLGAGKLLQQVPQQREPEPLYRQALSEIDAAGDAHLQSVAGAVVRGAPAVGKRAVPTMQFAGSPGDAVERARDVLQRTGDDPGALLDMLSVSTGALAKTHPEVYSGVVAKTAQVQAYLRQQLPPRVGATMLNPQGAPLSFDTAVDFLAKYLGATRPKQTMADIARGAASPEQVAAFQQNWPDRWQRLQMEVVGMVQRRTAAGRPLPSEKLRRLDSLLGLDGQLDASASPAVTQVILQSLDAAAAKQQAQGGQKAPNAAQSKSIASSFQSSHTAGAGDQ